jgi:hypothetical protein
MIEKVSISAKRHISVKLWPPSPHPQWGMSRATIELQEVKIGDDKQITYGQPLRLPCDSATALVTDLMKHLLLQGRGLNKELQNKLQNQIHSSSTSDPTLNGELGDLLLKQFANQKLSKTRIMTQLVEAGQEVDKRQLLQVLETLASQGEIIKEEAVHTPSNTKYYLWGFKKASYERNSGE